MAISAFLLAVSSLVSASVFIASKEHLLSSAVKRERWIDASICPKLFLSIDFWSCLSWPVTSFVWWVFLCYHAICKPSKYSFTPPCMQVDLGIPSGNYLTCHGQWTWSYISWRQKLGCCAYPDYLPGGGTHLFNILPHFQIPLEEELINCTVRIRRAMLSTLLAINENGRYHFLISPPDPVLLL